MSKDLGFRTAVCAIDNSGQNPFGNGFWVGKIDPDVFGTVPPEFEAYHIVVIGPSGSQLQVWVDSELWTTTFRGDVNEWDPKQPRHLRSGQTVLFYWNVGGASFPWRFARPTVNLSIREISPV